MTGDVTIGIVGNISIGSEHMLLGNDLGGRQVDMCEKPVMESCEVSGEM